MIQLDYLNQVKTDPFLLPCNPIDDLWIPVSIVHPRDRWYVIAWVDRSWQGKAESSAYCCHYFSGKGFDLQSPGGKVTHWIKFPQRGPLELLENRHD